MNTTDLVINIGRRTILTEEDILMISKVHNVYDMSDTAVFIYLRRNTNVLTLSC